MTLLHLLLSLRRRGRTRAAILSVASTGPILQASVSLPEAFIAVDLPPSSGAAVATGGQTPLTLDLTADFPQDVAAVFTVVPTGSEEAVPFLVDADNDGVADDDTPVTEFAFTYTGAPPPLALRNCYSKEMRSDTRTLPWATPACR